MSHKLENYCLIMEMGKSVLGVGEGGRVLMTSVDKELQSQVLHPCWAAFPIFLLLVCVSPGAVMSSLK